MITGFKKKSKFRSQRVKTDGHNFHSKLEASVYQLLKLSEKAGLIKLIQNQSYVYLTEARITYIPDFKCECLKNGHTFWVEAKGFETPEWRIKRKLWTYYGPGNLEVWIGTASKPFLKETIVPIYCCNEDKSM